MSMTLSEAKAKIKECFSDSFCINVEIWDHQRSGGERIEFTIYDCSEHHYGSTLSEALEKFLKKHGRNIQQEVPNQSKEAESVFAGGVL